MVLQQRSTEEDSECAAAVVSPYRCRGAAGATRVHEIAPTSRIEVGSMGGRGAIYNDRQIFQLVGGNRSLCAFDFAEIGFEDHYWRLFNGLPNLLYKKVEKVEFNQKTSGNTDVESILGRQALYSHFLFKILARMVPRTKSLTSIAVHGLDVPEKYLVDFFNGAAKANILVTIEFVGVKMTAQGGQSAFGALSPYVLEKLVLRDCSIPASVLPAVLRFLAKRERKPWKLRVLDLRGNFFSEQELGEIEGDEREVRVRGGPDESRMDFEEEEEEEEDLPEVLNRTGAREDFDEEAAASGDGQFVKDLADLVQATSEAQA